MKKTEIIQHFSSLEEFKKGDSIDIKSLREEDVVQIIKGINEGSRYWYQETKLIKNPIPNMSPHREPTYSDVTFDVYGKSKIFEPFVDFLLNVVKFFPNLTLYVHDGEFGFSPVFSVRYLNANLTNPYLIKFKENHLSELHRKKIIEVLYSQDNIEKHEKSDLTKIKELDSYEY